MQILILGRKVFKDYMNTKGITPENVESLKDVFMISVQDDTDDKYVPVFSENKKNVLVQSFSDVEEDTPVTIIGTNTEIIAKAFSPEQAKEMYNFIMANKEKKFCIIHCTAGISRSGAVGTFVSEVVGKNYLDLKKENPAIQPNMHVLKLLRQARLEDVRSSWVDFELDTNQYFGVVRFEDIEVIRNIHPDLSYLFDTRKQLVTGKQYGPPRFGFSSYFTGETLGVWLKDNNMIQYFK